MFKEVLQRTVVRCFLILIYDSNYDLSVMFAYLINLV